MEDLSQLERSCCLTVSLKGPDVDQKLFNFLIKAWLKHTKGYLTDLYDSSTQMVLYENAQ